MTHEVNDATPRHRTATTGTVIGLRDCGTLVILFLDSGDGRIMPVPVDPRAFRHLAHEKACGLNELIGRCVACDGDLVSLIE